MSQQLQAQFDEIHALQSNLQKTQKSAESVEKSCTQELNLLKVIQNEIAEQKNLNATSNDKLLSEIKKLLNTSSKEQLTKDDLKAVESFLRLIAANQMIQETYLETQ